jgi:hypothetical protein
LFSKRNNFPKILVYIFLNYFVPYLLPRYGKHKNMKKNECLLKRT